MKYNPNWNYIPFQNRASIYSESIKMHQHLWVKPTYEIGEVWQWYGDRVEIIKIFETGQVLVKIVETYEYDDFTCKNGKWVAIPDGDY